MLYEMLFISGSGFENDILSEALQPLRVLNAQNVD